MAEDIPIQHLTFGQAQHSGMQEEAVAMMETMRFATAPLLEGGDPQKMAILMGSAAMFTGSLIGTLIVAGLMTDQDKKRAVDAMARNIREGIEFGKRRAMRVMHETMGGGTA